MSAHVTFLGGDNQFDEQWLTLEQIASYDAAILYPNDIHQRTFHEVYKIGVPLLMPDSYGLYRVQRSANWGYTSYGGALRYTDTGVEEHLASRARPESALVPWWNSFNAQPEGAPIYFQRMADWEQFPHVLRFSNLAELLRQLL